MKGLEDLTAHVEREAEAEGPAAVSRLEAFRSHFRSKQAASRAFWEGFRKGYWRGWAFGMIAGISGALVYAAERLWGAL